MTPFSWGRRPQRVLLALILKALHPAANHNPAP